MAAMTYENLLDDKVRFLQGTQAQLNLYLPISNNAKRGTAIEGAFYLTTDTHRLYIGRKVNDANSADNGKIFPVQVSAGITTVANTGDLNSLSVDGERGDMYYIQDGNVLAVLEIDDNGNRSWVQVNPPTGITNFYHNTLQLVTNTSARLNSVVATQAGDAPIAQLDLKGERNIEVVAAAGDFGVDANGRPTVNRAAAVTIKGVNYELGTTATQENVLNGATATLVKNGSGVDSSLTITGDNSDRTGEPKSTIAVKSDANGTITISGPRFKDITTASPASGGFFIDLNYYSPLENLVKNAHGTLNPLISVGDTTPQTISFISGVASLPVYTKAEVDQHIGDSISAQLTTANAMNYRGTVNSVQAQDPPTGNSLNEKVAAHGAHIGDTYKVAGASKDGFSLLGATVYNGDLIIVRSSDDTEQGPNGTIESNKILYDIVPSGDEQALGAILQTQSTGRQNNEAAATIVNLVDTKDGNSTILLSRYKGTDFIDVKSEQDQTGKILDIVFDHRNIARNSDSNNETLSDALGSDYEVGNAEKSIFVLSDYSGLVTDTKGHVKGLAGTKVKLSHNRLLRSTEGYSNSVSNDSATSYGFLRTTLQDKIGNTLPIALKLSSQTLTFAADTNSTDLNVELLWGSF